MSTDAQHLILACDSITTPIAGGRVAAKEQNEPDDKQNREQHVEPGALRGEPAADRRPAEKKGGNADVARTRQNCHERANSIPS
jgi:hypothetical protein